MSYRLCWLLASGIRMEIFQSLFVYVIVVKTCECLLVTSRNGNNMCRHMRIIPVHWSFCILYTLSSSHCYCHLLHKGTQENICDHPDSNQKLSNPNHLHPMVTETKTELLGHFHMMSLLLCPRARQLSLDVHTDEVFIYDKSGAIWDTLKGTVLYPRERFIYRVTAHRIALISVTCEYVLQKYWK